MLRVAIVATIVAAAIAGTPSFAASSKQETCKFGADAQRLKGPERAKFIKNCMADRDDPRGPGSEPPK